MCVCVQASAFNSWFENAEEDLTDPVRCNSIEEIRALKDAHAQFQVSAYLYYFKGRKSQQVFLLSF